MSITNVQIPLGVSLILAQIWHERKVGVCIWALAANCTKSEEASRGFYGNGQNTQRRPEAAEQTTYMDAILHSVHFTLCKSNVS